MLKNLLFYTVAGGAIALIAQAAGAGLSVTLLSALIGPPFVLLVLALLRYKRIL